MTTGPGGGSGTGPGGGSGTGPGRDEATADILALIDENLFALGMAALALPEPSNRVETCGVEILKFRLRRARAAVADLLTYSGRDGKAASAESRPVQPPAGRPPLPGGDFLLPRDVRGPIRA